MAVVSDNGYEGSYSLKRVIPPEGPDDILDTDDIMDREYWKDLYRLGRYILPLRDYEIETHGVSEIIEAEEEEIPDYYSMAQEGEIPISKLPGMRTSQRVHTAKRIDHPMDTGRWDPDRQYLPDGSIDFKGW